MKKINIVLIALLLSFMQINAKVLSEDELIMEAIYYTDNKDPKNGAKIWKKLFELTNNEKYLVEYFYTSLQYKNIKDVIKELKVTLSKKKNKELYELLAGLYSKEGNTDGLLEVIKDTASDTESLFELAYLYTIKGKDKEALKIYKNIYKKDKSWDALKGELSILAKQKKITQAANLLWQELNNNKKLPKDAYLVYVGLINFKKDTKKAIYAFNKLYQLTNDKQYLKQIISLYLFNKDYDSIIKLLEKTHYDDKLLYELYLSKGKTVDAYKLLYRLYNETKKPKWLAEKAILTFEIANKLKAVDNRVLNRVFALFQKAIKEGAKSPTYYNYYGYTLIDYDKDIKKGINLVKKALKKEPQNIYYLDSLAWGYYKLKKCNEAKKIMQKIKNIEGTQITEDEIIKHNNIIQKCKEK